MSKINLLESMKDIVSDHIYADELWGSPLVGGISPAVEAVFNSEEMKAIKDVLIKYALPHDEWAMKYNLPTNLPIDVIEWLKS